MDIGEALLGVTRLFLDTAPVIYYVERNPTFFDQASQVFDHIDAGSVTAVTSPVTLAECLVQPYRRGLDPLIRDYENVITNAEHTIFQPIDAAVGQQAAVIRASYNLTLPDALQISAAIMANCEAFLTNDETLQRVMELRVIVLGNIVS